MNVQGGVRVELPYRLRSPRRRLPRTRSEGEEPREASIHRRPQIIGTARLQPLPLLSESLSLSLSGRGSSPSTARSAFEVADRGARGGTPSLPLSSLLANPQVTDPFLPMLTVIEVEGFATRHRAHPRLATNTTRRAAVPPPPPRILTITIGAALPPIIITPPRPP